MIRTVLMRDAGFPARGKSRSMLFQSDSYAFDVLYICVANVTLVLNDLRPRR